MTQNHSQALRHRVIVPLGGATVAAARSRAIEVGLDPASPEARLLAGIESPHTDWDVVVTFEVGAAGAVPVSLEIRSKRGEAVTRAVWDQVRPAALIQEARDLVAWLAPDSKAAAELATQVRKGSGRPREYPDEHYRRVAQVYLTASAQGLSPVREIAKAWEGQVHPGRPSERLKGLTSPTDRRARAWARAARTRGFLPPPTQRDVLGERGPKPNPGSP